MFRDMVTVRVRIRVRFRPKKMNWPIADGANVIFTVTRHKSHEKVRNSK